MMHGLTPRAGVLTRFGFIFAGLFVSALAATSSGAQIPDLETLRQLMEQGEELQGQLTARSPLDKARERTREDARDDVEPEGQAEEPLSPLERDYNERLGRDVDLALEDLIAQTVERRVEETLEIERQQLRAAQAGQGVPTVLPQERDQEPFEPPEPFLRQFGYDMFDRPMGVVETVTGRLPDDYVLGVGDELVVSFVGPSNRTVTTRVDREGQVVLPDLAPIQAAGRPFGEFRAALERRVGETLLGTEAFVSVAALRQISASVVGEVAAPGLYQVTSLTDLVELLSLAGGVKRTGSLRRVAIVSGGSRRIVDFYDMLRGAGTMDLRVRDGDRIVVPLIGATAAVEGLVVRPAIYELPPQGVVDVSDILSLAGGPLRPRGVAIQRNRVEESGRQRITKVDRADEVSSGDLYEVFPERNLKVGSVSMAGHVRREETLSLDTAPTVSALIKGGDALEQGPYLPFAVLETTDAETLQRIFRPIDLGRVLSGVIDVPLKDQDLLLVFGPEEIDFLSSPVVRGAILAPENVADETCLSLKVLAQRARQSDTERFAAALRSVFVTRGDGREESQLATASEQAADEVISLADLRRQATADIRCSAFFDARPEMLALALEYSLVATGAVRRPGLYPIAGDATMRDLVAAAGGLSLSADASRVEISSFRRGAAAAEPGSRRYVDLRAKRLVQIPIEPGSAVRFASTSATLEAGTVLLSGEFLRPGVYTIRRGETLLDVIERGGGITDQAYPYGAVFTRERVKQEQQESFRRTARELNNALALAVLKEDVGGDALGAARSLVQSFATIEAAGRVVVEADPAVLELNPELDTVLEAGDAIFMPKRPNFVLAAGDVLNPSALQFRPGKSVDDYLDEAGGLQVSADDDRVFVVFPNGVAAPVKMSFWTSDDMLIPPGSTIIVPKDVDPFAALDIIADVTQILSQVAISAASLAVVIDR